MSFLKAFIVVGLLPVLAMLAVGIYLQPLEGDLTRVGRVSERSWGWTKPRTVIDQLANVPTPETKIIVIGDSFSMGSLWQSVMQRASGLSFATYHWDSIGPPDCLKAALVTLLQKHPQARFVIVESVERHFVNRFSDWRGSGRNCPSAIYPSIRNVEKLGAWRKSAIDLSGGLPDAQYAFQALAAEGRSYEHAETTGQAVVAPLVRSDLFSNLRSDHLLYFAEDARRRHWTQEQVATAVGNMKTFAGAAAGLGVRPLFVIIPNKLTVYAPFLKEPAGSPPANIWSVMAANDVPTLPLASLFEREVVRHVDFYLPDDTHAGQDAFTIIGNEVANALAAAERR